MRDDTWKRLEDEFSNFPMLQAGSVPLEEIDAASAEIGRAFPDDYREFLNRYGGAVVGPYRIFGLRRTELMAKAWSVIEMNRKVREQQYPAIDTWLVISEDHAGNPFGIAPDGKVYVSDHDFGQIVLTADSFEDFIRRKCLAMSS
jgi:hypothetical protein